MELHNISVVVFNVKNYGAKGDGSTDDTASVQSAINACVAAGGGVVYFPKGVYILSGALDAANGSNYGGSNAQLYIPRIDSTNICRVEMVGESWCNTTEMIVYGSQKFQSGVLLKSTIDGTVNGTGVIPSVIGTRWWTDDQSENWNMVGFSISNIEVRVKSKSGSTDVAPTMSAINANYMYSFISQNVKASTESSGVDGLAPSINTWGIILPKMGNRGLIHLGGVTQVTGFTYGIKVQEHAHIVDYYANSVGCAIDRDAAGHQCYINKIHVEGVNYAFKMRANCGNIYVTTYGHEQQAPGKWWDFIHDALFDDATLSGKVFIERAKATTGISGRPENTLTTATPEKLIVHINGDTDLHHDLFTIDTTAQTWKGLDNGYNAQITLNGNKTITMSYMRKGVKLRLTVIQDATGGRTLSFSGYTVQLASGTTIATTANAVTILEGYNDGAKVIFYKVGSY